MAGRDVPTPDHYRYPWDGLASADLDGRFVELRWADGAALRAFDCWLRENAVGTGVDVASREGLLDPADLDPDLRVETAGLTDDGALRVRWTPDGVEAEFHPGWLRHVADGQHRVGSWLPEPRPWTAADLAEPPTHRAVDVLSEAGARRAWLADLLRFGIARLRGVPDDRPDASRELAELMGPIRDTNFGPVWDVSVDPEPISTANTTFRLGPHTDLPTRETPPGYQLLHCLANSVAGGESIMADGLAVVDHLARHHPDHHEALTTLRWIFFNRGEGIDHRWSGPIIDLGPPGSGPGHRPALTLRAFYPVRAFPDMDPDDVPRAYDALRCFSQTAADERFQLRFPFRPGDLVAFDNRRVLHGREGFSSTGRRHLRGLYMDADDVRSYARVMQRRAAAEGSDDGG